jgi:hypothetical protein
MSTSQRNQSDFMIGFRDGFPAVGDEHVEIDRSSSEYQRGLEAGIQSCQETHNSAPHLFTEDGLLREDTGEVDE